MIGEYKIPQPGEQRHGKKKKQVQTNLPDDVDEAMNRLQEDIKREYGLARYGSGLLIES